MAKNQRVTLGKLKDEIQKMDPQLSRDSETFRAAVVTFAGAIVGTKTDDIVKFTGYHKSEVKEWADNLARSGVFQPDGVAAGWFDEDGGVAFWLDVNCALGLMERTR